MSIAYGGIMALLFRGMNLVVAFGIVLLTSRVLSTDEYGGFVLGLTVVGLTNAMMGGVTAATAYQVANQRRAPGTALANGGVPALTLATLAIFGGFIAAAVLTGDPGSLAIPVGAASAAVILNSLIAGVFLGREAFIRYNLALVAPPLLGLACIIVTFFVLDHRSPEGAMAAYAIGQWLGFAVLALTSLHLFSGQFTVQGPLVRTIVRFAALAALSSGISYLNYRADLFVVTHFEGTTGAGIYGPAVNVAESLWQVSGSLALATYARLASIERPEAVALTTRVMRHTLVVIGALCLVLFAAADLIEQVAFPKYDGMASALRFLLPGVLMFSLAQSFSGFYTYQRGLPWVSAIVAAAGLAIDMVFAVILIPVMGVDGAALASTIAYSSAILAGIAVFMRQEHVAPTAIFRFGRADLDDYRSLLSRIRTALPGHDSPTHPLEPGLRTKD